jgi:hypothetical protein
MYQDKSKAAAIPLQAARQPFAWRAMAPRALLTICDIDG